jgi:2-polyprenyl-3-methyl-5-hydroxy-6-metoxy-1,4-benzoquinol methylase
MGERLHTDLRDFLFDAPGTWTMKKCPSAACGLAWLDPFPLSEDIGLAYQTYYTHAESPSSTAKSGILRKMLCAVYRFASSLPAAITGLRKEAARMSAMFLSDLPPGRLLDVGCGDGGFLNLMRQQGWIVEGMDFDLQAIAAAKEKYGVVLQHGDLASVHFQEASFDAITLNHVIEHVPDPLDTFARCRRLLKPGGRLVITTPNIMSLGHKHFGVHWRGLEPPRHLHLFSAVTLKECARRIGLEVLHAGTTAAHADIIFDVSDAIRNSPDHRLPVQRSVNLVGGLKAIAAQYWENLLLRTDPNCGEEVVLVCRKKPDAGSLM